MERASINGMCRCCASEGAFKDIKSSYHWMGEEEVYGEMLKRCFDIDLSSTEDSEGGICEVCITQLRNASNFKKQVLQTEEQFKQKLQMKFFKPTIVKVELQDENNQSDDNISNDDGFSGTEFEVSIKKEGTEEPKSKKRPSPAKASTSRAKKPKANEDSAETSTPKRKQIKASGSTSRERKSSNANAPTRTRLLMFRMNINEIMLSSNATPVRRFCGIGYTCCYCEMQFAEPALLKAHTLQIHRDISQANFMKTMNFYEFMVKLDVSLLTCKLCDTKMRNLREFIGHLNNVHDRTLNTFQNNRIVPMRFENGLMQCDVCENVLTKFRYLVSHMHLHYRNYVCDVCDAGFITQSALFTHSAGHKTGEFTCDFCTSVFNTYTKKKTHERCVHTHGSVLNKCAYCDETFRDYRMKEVHLTKAHGISQPTHKCEMCDKTYTTRKAMMIHLRRDHLGERRFACTECERAYFKKHELNKHMFLRHTRVKTCICNICKEAYGTRMALKEHKLKMHPDEPGVNDEVQTDEDNVEHVVKPM